MNALIPTATPSRFVSLADAASILSISTRQAYSLVRSGELPAIKIGSGGHWRIERVELELFIEALYEESRRRSLWRGSNASSITDLSGARR